MSQGSIWEYAAELRPRYRAASKEGKGRLLDEFCAVTRHQRKGAVQAATAITSLEKLS